ncbi:MAG TPA: hypothetical protein VHL77_10135 [Ferruginibacter sp.]|jgi:hypothetical protein|nr:hypothetical protein [Ferruginibacter sp.]
MKKANKLMIMFAVTCFLFSGCRNTKADNPSVKSVDGMTIKTFYTADDKVELQLITIADSFYVGRPTEPISRAQINGGMWNCVNRCRPFPGGPINTDCVKKCLEKIVVTRIE